jgi:hypothetical protein
MAADEINRRLPTLATRHIAWIKKDDLWVLTQSGITIFRGGMVETVTADQVPAIRNGAYDVLQVTPIETWVAGSNGIAIHKAGAWQTLTGNDGIPPGAIYTLRGGPDGAIWASGTGGVARFQDGKWELFDERNGLLDSECNMAGLWISSSGDVYVGTMQSLARFKSGVAERPKPELSCIWRGKPQADADGIIRLPPSQRTFLLEWAAPWLLPVPVEYRYRILPAMQEWSIPQNRKEILLERLSPGMHRAEVQARIKGAVESGWCAPLMASIYIEPQFLETVWAWLLGGFLIVLGFVASLQWRTRRLIARKKELQKGIEEALSHVKILRGLLPICASCKKIRDDSGYWRQIEAYIHEHTEADFTHGICPECMARLYPEFVRSAGIEESKKKKDD